MRHDPVCVVHADSGHASFLGRSLADAVMDIQRIKTALLRGKLDNLYLHNNPRVEVAESFAGPNTLDDLLVSRRAASCTKQPGGLNWQVVPDISGSIYPALGIGTRARNAHGRHTTGTGHRRQRAPESERNRREPGVHDGAGAHKLIARVIAETGVRIFSRCFTR